MLLRKYEMPWRRPVEFLASSTWAAAGAAYLALSPNLIPNRFGVSAALAALLYSAVRARQGLRIVCARSALSGRAQEVISVRQFGKLTRDPERVLFGYGFEWLPVHSQRLYELMKVDYREYVIPVGVLRLLGYQVTPQKDSEMGLPYIHGVEPFEQPLYRPLDNFVGGTLIVGTTQSGKGVCLSWLITQAIRRMRSVIVIDPKNSQRLKRIIMRACADYREPGTFLWFHPAFPEQGVRLDFTYSWQKGTEIASRIQSLLPPDTSGAFHAFGWDAVNVVTQAMISLESRPNLKKLKRYIEGGIEPILHASLEKLYEKMFGANWRKLEHMEQLFQKHAKNPKPPSPNAAPELLAEVEYYESHLAESQKSEEVNSQVRVFRHNREHYQKITANLLPILSMLTSDSLGKSLSPDPFDPDDDRPIMNLQKIENGGHVLLLCLDSLPDPAVASAIGALACADLAASAGIKYNLGNYQPVYLFVDEVSNCINQQLIEILNKGAESGIMTTVAMQTISDLALRLGSEHAARMALGNLNNLIAFRSKDQPTEEFITETFGKTAIHTVRVGHNAARDGHLGEFTAVESKQLVEEFSETIPTAMLGKLPNLQFFASVAGGRLCKGRLKLLDPGYDGDLSRLEETA